MAAALRIWSPAVWTSKLPLFCGFFFKFVVAKEAYLSKEIKMGRLCPQTDLKPTMARVKASICKVHFLTT